MYSARLKIFATIVAVILLALPAANLSLRAYIGGPLLPASARDLWSIDTIEGNLGYLAVMCCDRSLSPGNVRIGRDGYMFLGDDHADVMAKTTGQWPVADGLIEDRASRFVQLNADVTEAGGVLGVVIAPSKHSVYPDMLPADAPAATRTVTDDLIDAASARGVEILDLRPDMQRLRQTRQAYLKTDTHWTHAGAAASYDAVMAYLRGPLGISAVPVAYTLGQITGPAGDLAGLLKISEFYGAVHEVDYRIALTDAPRSCTEQIGLVSGEAGECAPQSGEVSVMERAIKHTLTPGAPNPQTVLMLCDSFCTTPSELFNASFASVYRVHWQFVNGSALRRTLGDLRPDIVILQMVERDALDYGKNAR